MGEEEDKEPRDGPVKWCKRCSRFHHSRHRCLLVAVTRIAKSGRAVTRYTHTSLVK